jgi:HPt (histidine-containing phosphotransfer) domain-containing protein
VDLLNKAALEELSGFDVDDLRDVVDLYVTDATAQLDRLHQALDAGDAPEVAEAAHRIKGSSLTVGAARCASLGSDIEVAARAGDLNSAPELAATLESELEPTRAALFEEFGIDPAD